ncbi:MAG: extracellular solute-binding protein [Bacteroidetes bacterium]|nr:extracellular solute-binding protein [Bacteroidota bacterium]
MRLFRFIILTVVVLFLGCNNSGNKAPKENLYVIHAGSLTYPVHKIARAFEAEYPGVKVLTEAWGSKAGARRIIELENPADVFLSADYMVIENMLIPEHASMNIKFARNEMSIVYTEKSRYKDEINPDNWFEILLKPDVSIGRSNPDHDPCGVRTVFVCKLAEIFYNNQGLSDRLLEKDNHNIRPKETDLIALLESGHIDYIFLYRSVAVQHKLNYLVLPDELNLGNPALDEWYAQVSTNTLGAAPGETIKETGQSMVYGLTIPHKSKNKELAQKFIDFLLDTEKGIRILEDSGQPRVN